LWSFLKKEEANFIMDLDAAKAAIRRIYAWSAHGRWFGDTVTSFNL
jgi:hypothetical protein